MENPKGPKDEITILAYVYVPADLPSQEAHLGRDGGSARSGARRRDGARCGFTTKEWWVTHNLGLRLAIWKQWATHDVGCWLATWKWGGDP